MNLLPAATKSTSLPSAVDVVFYTPHQDDETLAGGAALATLAAANSSVMVVGLTDGSASLVRAELGMTTSSFVLARNHELRAAAWALTGHGCVFGSIVNGTMTQDLALRVIRSWTTRYPKALHISMSTYDDNVEHKAAAAALTVVAGEGRQTRHVVSRPNWAAAEAGGGTLGYVTATGSALERLIAAVDAYEVVAPALGRYGIAYRSVPNLLEALRTDPRTLWSSR